MPLTRRTHAARSPRPGPNGLVLGDIININSVEIEASRDRVELCWEPPCTHSPVICAGWLGRAELAGQVIASLSIDHPTLQRLLRPGRAMGTRSPQCQPGPLIAIPDVVDDNRRWAIANIGPPDPSSPTRAKNHPRCHVGSWSNRPAPSYSSIGPNSTRPGLA